MSEYPKDFTSLFNVHATNDQLNIETPTGSWKRPDEVMTLYRLRKKKRALQARTKRSTTSEISIKNSLENNEQSNSFINKKRHNPFTRCSEAKRTKEIDNGASLSCDSSTDNLLFKVLSQSNANTMRPLESMSKELPNIINTLSELTKSAPVLALTSNRKQMPIDWSMKTKMRLISAKPFKWTNKLRTSEEASGVTGFVRCLDPTSSSQSLDTSMNAKCHQCCLLWQHPSLPWIQLFPRSGQKRDLNSGPNLLANNPEAVKSLHADWTESFLSLFQLVRAKQCPYFYVCANKFTILFRAAGICGFSETHAFLTPTTRGLRQTLKNEEIEYTMPLKKMSQRSGHGTEDSGCEILDSNTGESPQNKTRLQSLADCTGTDDEHLLDHDDDANDEQWLKSLGVDANEIKKLINSTEARNKHNAECSIDDREESLICVEGVEAQALFNFLLNYKSAITFTGPLSGIPPTLLAPVAFRGATLQALKVRNSKISVDNSEYYSMEICGPILPHSIHTLGALLSSAEHEYSITFANIESTIGFSKVFPKAASTGQEAHEEGGQPASVVFGQENLTDCGLPANILKLFCSSDPQRVQVIESLKFEGGAEHLYSWT